MIIDEFIGDGYKVYYYGVAIDGSTCPPYISDMEDTVRDLVNLDDLLPHFRERLFKSIRGIRENLYGVLPGYDIRYKALVAYAESMRKELIHSFPLECKSLCDISGEDIMFRSRNPLVIKK